MQYTLTSLLPLERGLPPFREKKRLRPLPSPLQGENERGGKRLGVRSVFPSNEKRYISSSVTRVFRGNE
jgi:hypothetical protein